MSRAGYSDDIEGWAMIRWRGQVASAIRGKRGQALLSEMLVALDAMPVKRLITEELENEQGEVCGLGALGKARGVEMKDLDPEDPEQIASAFNIASQLAREIAYENDEGGWHETPERRWVRVRAWVASKVKAATPSPAVGGEK